MRIPSERLRSYEAQLAQLREQARRYVWASFRASEEAGLLTSDDEAMQVAHDALAEARIAYGDQAARAAADLYDLTAEELGHDVPLAEMDNEFTDGEIWAQVGAARKASATAEDFMRHVANFAYDKAYDAARKTTARNADRDHERGMRYARVPTGKETCGWCVMLASRGFVYTSRQNAGDNGRFNYFHAHCVVPETEVSAKSLFACLRRDFEGVVVDLGTSGNRHLTVTPNHPVLTVRGWVPAGRLVEGDALLCSSLAKRHEPGVPDEHNVPPSIEQVFESCDFFCSALCSGMPATAEYFDGERIADCDINVVDVDGFFGRYAEPGAIECLGDDHLAPGGLPFVSSELNCPGVSEEGRKGCVGPLRGGMSCFGLPGALLGGHVGSSHDSRFGTIPDAASALLKPSGYNLPADSEDFREFKNALPTLVSLHDSCRCGDSLSSWLDTVALQDAEDGGLADFEILGNASSLFSGEVCIDYVTIARPRFYRGHVYDLSTGGGWYVANDIIVHNCDCRVVAGDEASTVEGYDPDWYYEVYSDARKACGSGDARDIANEINRRSRDWVYGKKPGEQTMDEGARMLPKERRTVDALRDHGFDVHFRATQSDKHKRTSDIYINGRKQRWEIKQPVGDGKQTIYHQFEEAAGQSRRLVLDVTEIEKSGGRWTRKAIEESVQKLIRYHYKGSSGETVQFIEVLVIGSDGYIRRFKQ